MAKLAAILDSIDDLDEPLKELYSKKGDKFELTGIEGVKTAADIERVTKTLNTEREAHKAIKAKYAPLAEYEVEDIVAKLDKYEELEAAASGKLDDEKINKLVETRLKTSLAPKDRDIKKLTDENATLKTELEQLRAADKRRRIHDAVRAAAVEHKLLETATEDALLMAERVMDIDEDGNVLTRDNVGFTPGSTAKDWLAELQPKRPHWWPATQGSGGKGSGGGGSSFANNPWSADHWNLTAQGAVIREKGRPTADKMAQAAGTTVGGPRPMKKAS